MFIDCISLKNFRTFRKSKIAFIHADADFSALGLPTPQLQNINLLLGDNGLGKTSLLKAIALTALGPAVGRSGIYPYHLVRREPVTSKKQEHRRKQPQVATLEAAFTAHKQDRTGSIKTIESHITVYRNGDLESLDWTHQDEKLWHPIFKEESDALFMVGYGPSRRAEQRERIDFGGRKSRVFPRAQRIQSLFEEAYSLIPLSAWLPTFKAKKRGRYLQVVNLINSLLGDDHYSFGGLMDGGEFLFERHGLRIPFPALSDGYKAFLGWVSDLLYHLCMTCPPGKKLVETKGLVMVDEIDLHLHPKWQLTVLPTIAKALPNIQFILTSHSPLLVGSLEWMNIIVMKPGPQQSSHSERIPSAVHGLDADQVLLTDFFGLESTRAPGKKRELKRIALRARSGDTEAARRLIEEMVKGMEPVS